MKRKNHDHHLLLTTSWQKHAKLTFYWTRLYQKTFWRCPWIAAQWRQINYAVMLQHNDDKSTTRLCSQTTPVRMCTGNEMKDAVRGLHHGTTSEYAWNDHRKWRHISAEIKCAFFEITRVPLEFKLRYSFFSLSYTVINSDYSLEWYSKHSLYVKHTLHIKCE